MSKRSGVEIDKFIKSTKRFINNRDKTNDMQESVLTEESILVADDDINKFIEVVG